MQNANDTTRLLKDYYSRGYKEDLKTMFGRLPERDIPNTFGNDWMGRCSLLPRVNPQRRAALLVCAFFDVLADQAMHSHFFLAHSKYEQIRQPLKFLVGFGHEMHLSPFLLFTVPIQHGLVAESAIRELIPGGAIIFVRELADFFNNQMPEVSPKEFFNRLLQDRHVIHPAVHADQGSEPLSSLVSNQLLLAAKQWQS